MATSDGDSHDEHAVQKRVGSMPGVCSIAPTSLVHQNFSRGISEVPETRLSAESVLIFKEQLEQALPPPPPPPICACLASPDFQCLEVQSRCAELQHEISCLADRHSEEWRYHPDLKKMYGMSSIVAWRMHPPQIKVT